jgi:aryl-alcohol dehydrogenase-like predicted oxidoreductase
MPRLAELETRSGGAYLSTEFMPKRTSPSPTPPHSVSPPVFRATSEGSARLGERFQDLAPGFYRPATFGVSMSSIGIGTYLGDSTDEEDTAYQAALHHAVSSGINVIDTAINYRSQRSERAVGAAIQQLLAAGTVTRDQLVISSKGGYIPLDRTPPASRDDYRRYVQREFVDQQILRPDEIVGGGHSLAPRFLRYCLAKSRQNLGLRTIDIYYVHNPGHSATGSSPAELRARLRAAFVMLEEAAGRGEIGVYGCATWDELRVGTDTRGHIELEMLVELAKEVAGDANRFKVVQLPINLAMPEAVRSTTQSVDGRQVSALEAASELGLTVIASATLMQGRLTSGLPAALRDHFPGAQTDAQRALEFVRSIPGVTSALVGMKNTAHVAENMELVRRR